MEMSFLPKRGLARSVVTAALGVATIIVFVMLPGKTAARRQLNQITSCVEVPSAVASASGKRKSTRSDCDPDTAFRKARDQSRVNARDWIAPECRDQISEAEAEEICRAANGSIPSGGTTVSGTPVALAGSTAVHTVLPISQTSPKICAILRNVPDETETSTRAADLSNGFCVFNRNLVTSKTVRTRVRCGVQCFNVHQRQLRVRRFTSSILSASDADRILADATAVLKTDEGAGDVACGITLSRVESVSTFTTGDGSIDTRNEFNSIVGLPGHVKVVNAINFCDGIDPNTIGCAPMPGNSLVVERVAADLEGLLWAHEFGHNQGLDHRNNANAVMNESISVTRRRVNSDECQAYRSTGAAAAVPDPAVALLRPEGSSSPHAFLNAAVFRPGDALQDDVRPPDIRQFVRQTYIHGVPYGVASKFSPDVVPTLLEMLKAREEEPHWANIVVVLGIIGDERALDGMIAFVEGERGRISPTHYRAKRALIISLGYVINKTGSRKALNYLTTGLNPGVWPGRLGLNLAPYQKTLTERNRDFAKYAILGLALSGHPDALPALRSLQQQTTNRPLQEFRAEVSDLVVEALKEHQQVAAKGLADYYRSR